MEIISLGPTPGHFSEAFDEFVVKLSTLWGQAVDYKCVLNIVEVHLDSAGCRQEIYLS